MKRTVNKRDMVECENTSILIKRYSKIICFYDMLLSRTFRACRKSLHVCYGQSYERARNFLRAEEVLSARVSN